MASTGNQYPDHLNPFDYEERDDVNGCKTPTPSRPGPDDYPDHLDPFGDETAHAEEYDDSLNPFGEDIDPVESNPFETDDSQDQPDVQQDESNPIADGQELKQQEIAEDRPPSRSSNVDRMPDISITQSLDSLEPPKPLPRTKSLLKKEQQRKRLQELHQSKIESNNHTHSIQSTSSSTTSSSSTATTTNVTTVPENDQTAAPVGSFQRKKNKRIAPPVPINFKREVTGSLDAIEEELNGIGDKLAIIDKETTICQKTLTAPAETDEENLRTTKSKFIELIKRRNSIVRRQRELMYTKRELKLDQLHSDIEYELRMIGNKQISTRTPEDEAKEKELLKKLVEIVEEKNDIVENLNKDTSCDNHDIEEAFKRLNITDYLPDKASIKPAKVKNHSAKPGVKGDSCDRGNLAKLSKIATLLPRGNTIKLKRPKKLFRKTHDSKSIGPQTERL